MYLLFHTNVCPTGLYNLSCEGCSSHAGCQLSKPSLLFNWKQVIEPVFYSAKAGCLRCYSYQKIISPLEFEGVFLCKITVQYYFHEILIVQRPFCERTSEKFFFSRWQSVDGTDQACRSCDVSQWFEKPSAAAPITPAPKTTKVAQAHPIMISQERKAEHYPATFIRLHPGEHQSIKPQQSKLIKRNAKHEARKYKNWTI